ncbi:cytochrome P450 CYP12A2-like [Danaus plexippus]|uniref:cytochrome P450 CYP12A2-like n=1 Tax=Danaus plexippus TaxID=13037 RepID=UPI002AAFE0A3|nr:cytochrome P450 CYP12A2-like [Danaus plexippus]
MQVFKRSTFWVAPINKNISRSVSVHKVSVNVDAKEIKLKSWREIPGPPTLPLIGQLHHFFPGGMLEDVSNLGDVLYEKYGPIAKLDGVFGGETVIFLFDAEAASQVLWGENRLPYRPSFISLEYYRKVYSNKGKTDIVTGLGTDHGKAWKKFRSTVNPIMLQPKTIILYSNTLNEVAEDMIKRLKSKRNDKNMIEGKFDEEMNLWALETIGVVALGDRLNCFDPNLPENSPVKKMIQIVHNIFKYANKLDFNPSLWKYISTPTFKKAMQCYEDQMMLSRYFIDKAIEKLDAKNNNANEEKAVLQKLLEIDKDVAIIMASDMLLAGVDTAANTIIATLYLLATNPDKQDKLREEIKSQKVKKYLKAVLKESMRILPVASGNMRLTTKDYNILGYHIPKNVKVTFHHQTMSKSDKNFPRPLEYLPERWLAEKTDPLYYGNAHPFAFVPFGFGIRSCIGRRIAELEIETFLSKVIENFHVEWFGPPLRYRTAALNYMCEPFNFIFKDVK